MSKSSKGYQFIINGNTVTAVHEVERGRVKFEPIDSDEAWTFDGTHVIKTEMDDGRLERTTYSDVDEDGLFSKTSKTYSGADSASGRNNDDNNWSDSTSTSNVSGYSEKGYQFDIDTSGVVNAVYQVKYGRVETERMDWNETWKFDGLNVTQTETKFGKVDTTVYTDTNQDGIFQKGFELEVLTGANLRSQETHKFIVADGANASGDFVAEGETIIGMMELNRHGWKMDRIDTNETLQVVEVGMDSLILKTKIQWNGKIDFSVFRDDENDGLWTEIADGETLEAFVTLDGQVDLVGIADAGLLQAADGLIA